MVARHNLPNAKFPQHEGAECADMTSRFMTFQDDSLDLVVKEVFHVCQRGSVEVGADTGLLKVLNKAGIPSSNGDEVRRFGEYSFNLFQSFFERRETDDAHTERLLSQGAARPAE